ncbi:MAG TPA: ABC transporter ATP-binding protein [Solirubrobacterales bacterium]|nr:ABC transporter ATP-binding protein [Solirubrobacterales bacterium]
MTIETEALSKLYRGADSASLSELSFSVNQGEAVALVGANGAGKSTVIRVLSTLLRPTSGRASVAGFDVVKEAGRARQEIGVVQQQVTLDLGARVHDILELHAQLLGLRGQSLRRRVKEVLALAGLEQASRRRVRHLSGGMQRKLDIGLALINRPAVLLLDEPTDSLDLPSRFEFWAELSRLRDAGTCILFSSQDQEEIRRLADRAVVLANGVLVREEVAPGAAGETWPSDVAVFAG